MWCNTQDNDLVPRQETLVKLARKLIRKITESGTRPAGDFAASRRALDARESRRRLPVRIIECAAQSIWLEP